MLVWGALRLRRPDEELGARRPRPSGAPRRRTPSAALARLPRRRVHADAAARLRPPALMHSMIYFGFLVLLGVTTVLEVDHQLPRERSSSCTARTYQAYAFVGDAAGLVFLVGIVWAIVRRYVQRPYRIRIKTKPEHAAHPRHVPRDRRHRLPRRDVPHRRDRPARATRSGASSATRCRQLVDGWSPSDAATRGTRCMWIAHVVAFFVFLAHPADHDAAPHVHVAAEHVPEGPGPPEGRDEADAQPHRDRAGDVRRLGGRGLHLEAAARHRRLHDVRPLHERVPGPRHRQAARPPRDRAQDRRGHGRHRGTPAVSARRSASTARSRSPPTRCSSGSPPRRSGRARRCKACDEICPVNIEILDKILDMRRYLSLMESQLPGRARQRLPGDGEPGQPVGHEPGRARRLGQRASTASRSSTRASRSAPSTSTGSAAPGRSTTRTRRSPRRWPSCCAGPASTSPSSGRREMCTGDPARRSRQRVPVPDAGHAEHRDAQRHGREEDHHPVPALLQHAEERVPAARRQLRGDPPQPAARAADRRRAARRERRRRSRSGSRTTTRATSAATTTCTWRRARWSARSRASRSSRCRATAPRACAAAPAGRGRWTADWPI